MKKARQDKRSLLYALVRIVLVISILEVTSYVGGAFIDQRSTAVDMKTTRQIYREQRARIEVMLEQEGIAAFDPQLGWVYRAGFRSDRYNNNSIGLRGTREYALEKPPHILRIAAFGDSFVYGSEVADEDVWSVLLEKQLPELEVLNFGVPGYGTDQAFLHYGKHGKAYTSDVVLIGFAAVNLRRNVNVYRRFISTDAHVQVKPRFRLGDDGELVLIPMPIASLSDYKRYYDEPARITELGVFDATYRPFVYQNPLYDYSATIRLLVQVIEVASGRLIRGRRLFKDGLFDTESEAYSVTLRIILDFADQIEADGSTPLVLVFPEYEAIRGDASDRIHAYAPLLRALEAADVRVVNLELAFDEPVTRSRHFMPGGHLSPKSNALIARFLADYLQRESWVGGAQRRF